MDDRAERLERCRDIATTYETLGYSESLMRRLRSNAFLSECYIGPALEQPSIDEAPETETREDRMSRLWAIHVARPHPHVRY